MNTDPAQIQPVVEPVIPVMDTGSAQIQSIVDQVPLDASPTAPVYMGKEGSVIYQEKPKLAETPSIPIETSPSIETQKPVEVPILSEKMAVAVSQIVPVQAATAAETIETAVSTSNTQAMVVDKSTNKAVTHNVAPDADKITSLADIEENEFIQEVEEHSYDRK